jgi:hypothetical protein
VRLDEIEVHEPLKGLHVDRSHEMSDIESGASSSDGSVGSREDDWEWGDDEAPATTRYFQTLRANLVLRKPNPHEDLRAGLAPCARSGPPRAGPRAAAPHCAVGAAAGFALCACA